MFGVRRGLQLMKRETHWPPCVPDGVWVDNEVVDALRQRDIAALLMLIRRHTGHSQNDIACLTGIAQGRISEYMRGVRQPTLDTIERIATGVGMPPEPRRLLGLAPAKPA